jgi:hypothetical protein
MEQSDTAALLSRLLARIASADLLSLFDEADLADF